MHEIKVKVVEFGDRKHYQMQYRDPITGRKKTKSTGVERTGRKRERTEAERVAAKFEAELCEGRYKPTSKVSWQDFRDRYETEELPKLADETVKKVYTTFRLVERILQPVLLRDLTTERLSAWVATLRREGRSEATIGVYCRHLRSALNWAVDIGKMIPEAPKIQSPKQVETMKGRAIKAEEYERMQMSAGKVVQEPYAPLWERFLEGLWWSGLRLDEAIRLSWEPSASIYAEVLPNGRAVLRFKLGSQKAKRAELWPCPPEFAEMLAAVPEDERTGYVFELRASDFIYPHGRLSKAHVGCIISDIGKAAGVLVDPETEKHATAHDYRRAFGTRWAKRILPLALKKLMRHRNIKTTEQYYVDQDVDEIADQMWDACSRETGNTSGNSGRKRGLKPAEQ